MKTTHTRISLFGLRGLDYLCGLTGENRQYAFDDAIAWLIQESINNSDLWKIFLAEKKNVKKIPKPVHILMSIAHRLVNKQIKEGKIVRPKNCSMCLKENGKIIAHHYLGYDGENALKIMWLCNNCHIQQHYIYGFKIGLKEYDAAIARQNKASD